jgi:cation diffusion facilitator CzcD-associated flavoprotein CzcO
LWSTFYAKYVFILRLKYHLLTCIVRSPEILKYFENFRKDENLDEYVQLNTKVVSAVWDAGKGIYNVEVESHGQLKQDWCHVLVNASGNLNKWKCVHFLPFSLNIP